jgi:hypothetical protein
LVNAGKHGAGEFHGHWLLNSSQSLFRLKRTLAVSKAGMLTKLTRSLSLTISIASVCEIKKLSENKKQSLIKHLKGSMMFRSSFCSGAFA